MPYTAHNLPPFFSFADHPPGWLSEIADIAKPEPWGKNFKVLELYLKANFRKVTRSSR